MPRPLILSKENSEKFWLSLSNWFEEKSQLKPIVTKQPDWSVLDVDRDLEEETWKHRFCQKMHCFCYERTQKYWDDLDEIYKDMPPIKEKIRQRPYHRSISRSDLNRRSRPSK